MSSRLRRRVPILFSPALVVSLALGVLERDARAQATAPTITINPLVTRNDGNGAASVIRPQNLNPTGISFSDCELDQTLNLSLSLSAFGSDGHLEAWVGGADCGPSTARTGTTAICWPVNQHITVSSAFTVPIRVRDIVAHQSETTKPTTYTAAGEEACHVQSQSGPVSLGVYFLWLVGAQPDAASSASYPVKADMQGPGAPTLTSIGQGDTLLLVNWNPVVDPDTSGFTVYCDPPPNGVTPPGGAADASTSDDAGAPTYVCDDGGFLDAGFDDGGIDDTGDATPPQPLPPIPIDSGVCRLVTPPVTPVAPGSGACSSTVLVAGGGTTTTDDAGNQTSVGGTQRLIDPAYICGTFAGNNTNQATITGLKDGVNYTIAVAGSDAYGNSGPLSNPQCGVPVPVDDFWKRYRESGGLAGGGFCALQAVGMPVEASIFGLTGAFAAIALARRRQRRRGEGKGRDRDRDQDRSGDDEGGGGGGS